MKRTTLEAHKDEGTRGHLSCLISTRVNGCLIITGGLRFNKEVAGKSKRIVKKYVRIKHAKYSMEVQALSEVYCKFRLCVKIQFLVNLRGAKYVMLFVAPVVVNIIQS